MSNQPFGAGLLYQAKQLFISGKSVDEITKEFEFVDEKNNPDYKEFTQKLLEALTAGAVESRKKILSAPEPEFSVQHKSLREFFSKERYKDNRPCHVYLVNSGNHDGVYKIGFTNDKTKRIAQIQKTYGVPNATIVQTVMLNSRQMAVDVEAQLHQQYNNLRVNTYYGTEWFQLSESNVKTILNFFASK